jgi:hypothetical protein
MVKKILSLVLCLATMGGIYCLNQPQQQTAKIGAFIGGAGGYYAADVIGAEGAVEAGLISVGGAVGFSAGQSFGTVAGQYIGCTIGSVIGGPAGAVVGYLGGAIAGRWVGGL